MIKSGLPQPQQPTVLEFIDAIAEVVATALAEDHNQRRLAGDSNAGTDPPQPVSNRMNRNRNRKKE